MSLVNPRPTKGFAGRLLKSCLVTTILSLSVGAGFAHNGVNHDDAGIKVEPTADNAPLGHSMSLSELPANLADLGGAFSLTDHFGNPVTDKTYAGKHMLVFFGYSNCQVMCSISLKRIGDALALLDGDSASLLDQFAALVITVDPANDTPQVLRESLGGYHPALTGLTGTLEQLKPVYEAYGQKPEVLDVELGGHPVVQHASFFFLMGPDGELDTLFPPILNAESMAAVLRKYLPG